MGLIHGLNNILVCYGKYAANASKETVDFPISYTQSPSVIANTNWNNTNEIVYPSRFPYDVTITGFTRAKATRLFTMSWISIGY